MIRLFRTVFVVALAASLCLSATPGFASSALETLRQSVDGVVGTLRDQAYRKETNKDARRKLLMAKIEPVFDPYEISGRALGPNWSKFTPDQRARFSDAFTHLLQRTWLDRLEAYTDEVVEYGEQTMLDANKAEIKTRIKGNKVDVPITYRLIQKNETWKVYDIVVEGVSLLQNYRSQFNEILSKQSPEELISRLSTMS